MKFIIQLLIALCFLGCSDKKVEIVNYFETGEKQIILRDKANSIDYVKEYYPNGNLKILYKTVFDEIEGDYWNYDINGKIDGIYEFKNSELDGMSRIYDSFGNLKFIRFYEESRLYHKRIIDQDSTFVDIFYPKISFDKESYTQNDTIWMSVETKKGFDEARIPDNMMFYYDIQAISDSTKMLEKFIPFFDLKLKEGLVKQELHTNNTKEDQFLLGRVGVLGRPEDEFFKIYYGDYIKKIISFSTEN